MKGVLWVVVVSVVVAAWIPLSHCSKKPVGVAGRKDIPDMCQVCDKLARELYHQVGNKKAEIGHKKISEGQISEIAKNVCNLIQLVEQDSEGQCNSECKTIEQACQELIESSDTDVTEYLYRCKPDIDSLRNRLCKNFTEACSTKPPAVPKDRAPGEPFAAKSSKEAEMEKLPKSMENLGDEDGDDEDEDKDDEGKVLRTKESGKEDCKQMLEDTSKTLKKLANKVSNQVRLGCKGKKATNSKKGGKTEL